MFVFQQVIDSILLEVLYRKVITTDHLPKVTDRQLLEVLYRKVITSQTFTICNNLNIYQQMIKQEEFKIRKSISEKIKKKDIRKFISVTKVRYEELIDIIFSFLKIKRQRIGLHY